VPQECDAVELKATRVADGEQVYAAHHDLSKGPIPFPLELALSTENRENVGEGAVELEVKALKGDTLATPWSIRTHRLDLRRRQWTQATIELCDVCPTEQP
jgi:hypothetical protein